MFERFTDRARKVMAFANQEAILLNNEYIGTEHILLGFLKEGSGVGANVLKNKGINPCDIRAAVNKLVKHGPEMVIMGKLPTTIRSKRVIEFAIEEAKNLNHNYCGTEHLLLGMLREGESTAAVVLANFHLSLTDARNEIQTILKTGDVKSGEPSKHKSTGEVAWSINVAPSKPAITITEKDDPNFCEIVRIIDEAIARPWGPNELYRYVELEPIRNFNSGEAEAIRCNVEEFVLNKRLLNCCWRGGSLYLKRPR